MDRDLLSVIEIQMPKQSETINIGGVVSYALSEVVNMILSKLGSSSKIILEALQDRIEEDISKAKKLLSWEPETSWT